MHLLPPHPRRHPPTDPTAPSSTHSNPIRPRVHTSNLTIPSFDSSSQNRSPIKKPFKKLRRRLSSTYQSIAHLSSSFTDSIHPNSFNRRASVPSTDLSRLDSIPSSLHHPSSSSLPHQQNQLQHQPQQHYYHDLSSHRRKVLGAVPDQWPMYSNDSQDYLLGPQIGFGTSSVVRLAHFKPRPGELCAVKVIDIDRLTIKQIDYLRRETLLMSLAKHPNVLRVRGEWIQDSSLCIAMRLMKAGSVADLINLRFQDGLSESVIASVLIQAIAGLNYLHSNDWIHRDIKAANLLLDHDGTVLLADFGVSLDRKPDNSDSNSFSAGFLKRQSDHSSVIKLNLNDPSPHSSPIISYPQLDNDRHPHLPLLQRQASFVGTALFMAPEVVTHQLYTDKTDIWSFGITALEMAVGKAPRSMNPPAKVLMKTVQEPSPKLDRRRIGSPNEYSKKFERLVDRCLNKDPSRRPSSRELLFNEPFFRQARPKNFLVQTILVNLPPLETRQERLLIPPPQQPTRFLPVTKNQNCQSIHPSQQDSNSPSEPIHPSVHSPPQPSSSPLHLGLSPHPFDVSFNPDLTTPASEYAWDFNVSSSSDQSRDPQPAEHQPESITIPTTTTTTTTTN